MASVDCIKSNYDEFVKSRIHQVLGVKFYVNDIVYFNRCLKLKS